MKGRKSCYAGGGGVRDIGGIRAPAYGTSSKVMDIARRSTSEGKVGMEGIGANGVPVKSRLDRPGRKAGGRVAKPMKSDSDDDDDDRGMRDGGPLTAKARDAIATKNFALPGRRYPIEDPAHARNALARVSQHGSATEKSKIRSAVKRKFPSIGKDD